MFVYYKTTGKVSVVLNPDGTTMGLHIGTTEGNKFFKCPPLELHKEGVFYHTDSHGRCWIMQQD